MPDEVRVLLPGEASEDAELVERVVQGARRIHIQKGFEYYLELGQFVIDEMFGGDYAALQERARTHKSFRALALRDDLPMSYVTLNAAVRVTHQIQSLPPEAREQLTMGHHKALLPVPRDTDRKKLARDAIAKGWTVDQLKNKVRARIEKTRKGETRGRRPLPKFEKTLNLFRRVLEADDAFEDLDQLETLPPERARELRDTLDALKSKVGELQAQVESRVAELE